MVEMNSEDRVAGMVLLAKMAREGLTFDDLQPSDRRLIDAVIDNVATDVLDSVKNLKDLRYDDE